MTEWQPLIHDAAQFLAAGIPDLPIDDEIDHRGYDEDDATDFVDLIDELTWADLVVALTRAARRLEQQA